MRVTVENCGSASGKATIQLYGQAQAGERTGERELLGFTNVWLGLGEEREVSVLGDLQPLQRWDTEGHTFSQVQGSYLLEATTYWGNPDAAELTVVL